MAIVTDLLLTANGFTECDCRGNAEKRRWIDSPGPVKVVDESGGCGREDRILTWRWRMWGGHWNKTVGSGKGAADESLVSDGDVENCASSGSIQPSRKPTSTNRNQRRRE